MNEKIRLNIEWLFLTTVRGIKRIATKGNKKKITYKKVHKLGAKLSPEILGEKNSILYRENKSKTAREFIQKAQLKFGTERREIYALDLIQAEIDSIDTLIESQVDTSQYKDLKARLRLLKIAREELGYSRDFEDMYVVVEDESLKKLSEHKIINKDTTGVTSRGLLFYYDWDNTVVYRLPNKKQLVLRILHPDRLEHITGADVIYECHDDKKDEISLAFLQYKIWHDRKLYLSKSGLRKQVKKMINNTCEKGLCECKSNANDYRFPYCTSFLRPTDALQNSKSPFISTGYHLPICKLDDVTEKGVQDGEFISQESIKDQSISSELFEELFNSKKLGSKFMNQKELNQFYESINLQELNNTVIIYAQELKS